MELFKTLFVVLSIVVLSSVVSSAPARFKTVSDLKHLVRTVLPIRINHAITEMKKIYPDLKEPGTNLGLQVDDGSDCSSSQDLKEKLFHILMALSLFKSPLYMAYSYEQTQGPQHSLLALTLKNTSYYVNATVADVRRKIEENSLIPPSGPATSSQAELDRRARKDLQTPPDSVMNRTITDNLVKIHRNYVIMYTLHDVIKMSINPCIKGV